MHLIVPVGTQVVTLVEVKGRAGGRACPRGAVGEVVTAPQDNSHSYRLRFADGTEGSLRRHEFAVRKHHQAGELLRDGDALSEFSLYEHVIYSCVVGSRAYGLDDEGSDTDRRGVYLPPAELHWSLYGVPEQLENEETRGMLLGAAEVPRAGAQGQPERARVPLHAARRARDAARRGAARHAGRPSSRGSSTRPTTATSCRSSRSCKQDLRNQRRGEVEARHAPRSGCCSRALACCATASSPVRVGRAPRARCSPIRRGEMPWDEIERVAARAAQGVRRRLRSDEACPSAPTTSAPTRS